EKKYVVPGTRSNGGEQRKNRSHNASVIWPETILKSAFVDNSHPTKVIN
ncbi:transglycosylase, partial [Salmonella enterica subsp. enterica serovar Typhimurium]|nr:transglycosylase [Salmonella enterica subsp. enterica serovar Typhimurium]EFA3567350.1 transglycosylase [Escherichia coli]